jgi:hypothetical protein
LDAICVIAAPGTGTNHLREVLRNFSDLASYLEPFAPDGVCGIDPEALPLLRRLTGIGLSDLRDPRLAAFVHERPAAWLDVLEIVARDQGKRVMSFNLFHDHMTAETVEHELMPRTGLRVVLVMRRQIDSYVAWRRAAALATLPDAGRLGVKVKLNPEHFGQWLDAQERWYAHWRDALKRRFLPCPALRYEFDIERQPPEAVLRRFAAAAAQVGITLRPPGAGSIGETPPQRARNLSDDVSNWIDFSRELFRRGLEKRAFGYPIQ